MTRTRGRPRGWRAPDPRAVMVNVRLTASETATLDVRVAKDRTSRSALLREGLRRFLRYLKRRRP